MKIHYTDPLAELESTLIGLQRDPKDPTTTIQGISHVSITLDQMRAVVNHSRAESVFPNFIGDRNKRLAQYSQSLRQIRQKLAGNTLSDSERNHFFDRQHALEIAERDAKAEVPKQTTAFNGIVVKVSLSA